MRGDCKRLQCNGSGATVQVNDNADIDDDGNACTLDSCSNGVPVRGLATVNTPCGVNLLCSDAGTCVGCNQPSDCGGPVNCRITTCTNGVCGALVAPDDAGCNDDNLAEVRRLAA